jgi:hypothetical protein
MQYKVPQNIDQEDKILGPLTFVQFIYVLVGGAVLLLLFTIFDFTLFLLVAVPITILTLCFALVKIQDQPFSRIFFAFLIYIFQPKRRTWKDILAERQPTPIPPEQAKTTPAPSTTATPPKGNK